MVLMAERATFGGRPQDVDLAKRRLDLAKPIIIFTTEFLANWPWCR